MLFNSISTKTFRWMISFSIKFILSLLFINSNSKHLKNTTFIPSSYKRVSRVTKHKPTDTSMSNNTISTCKIEMHNIHFIPNATPRVSHCGYIIQQLTGFEADSFSPQYNISYFYMLQNFILQILDTISAYVA